MAITNNYVPEKINDYNAYLNGTLMIGVTASVEIPEIAMKASEIEGIGINGTLDDPTIGQFESMEASVTLELTYIMIEVDGEQLIEIDKLNGVYKRRGVDMLAEIKTLI